MYKVFYKDKYSELILGNCFEILPLLQPNQFDMIFADPPYFLSNNGITCSGGKAVSVNKGNWDKIGSLKEKHEFNRKWIKLCHNLLKPTATIWISGTFHNIYSIGMALEEENYKILNNITWVKSNPPPNLACKCFTHSTETILWASTNDKKTRYLFNYDTMKKLNNGKQMRDVWEGSLTPQSEKKYGKHPTQKPEYILERIINASTNEGDIVLDPFCGSSTTGVVCKKLKRIYIGIDNNTDYLTLSKERLQNTQWGIT